MSKKHRYILHTVMAEMRGGCEGRDECAWQESQVLFPTESSSGAHEWSARAADLVCYLALMVSLARALLLRYALLENQLEMKSDRSTKETGFVFSVFFFNTNPLGNCDTSPKG